MNVDQSAVLNTNPSIFFHTKEFHDERCVLMNITKYTEYSGNHRQKKTLITYHQISTKSVDLYSKENT